MISEHISDDIPPQVKILNMVIPILMHFKNFPFKKTVNFVAPIRTAAASCIKPLASCIYSLVNQWKVKWRNDVEFPTVYHKIYCCKFKTLSNQKSGCICKCIRMCHYHTHVASLTLMALYNVLKTEPSEWDWLQVYSMTHYKKMF